MSKIEYRDIVSTVILKNYKNNRTRDYVALQICNL